MQRVFRLIDGHEAAGGVAATWARASRKACAGSPTRSRERLTAPPRFVRNVLAPVRGSASLGTPVAPAAISQMNIAGYAETAMALC